MEGPKGSKFPAQGDVQELRPATVRTLWRMQAPLPLVVSWGGRPAFGGAGEESAGKEPTRGGAAV